MADCRPAQASQDAERLADLPDVPLGCLGSGENTSLADIQGPAIVNFWSSACGPCRDELPVIQQFHQKFGDQVRVIGMNYLDTYPGAAIELAGRSGVTYPSFADPCGDLQGTSLVIAGMPTLLVVDEQGEVGAPHSRAVKDLDELVTLVEGAVGINLN